MRLLILGATMAVAACASVPPEGSIAQFKLDARRSLIDDCLVQPERFGFPNTRAENADLLLLAPQAAPNVYRYCGRVARSRVP